MRSNELQQIIAAHAPAVVPDRLTTGSFVVIVINPMQSKPRSITR